MQFLAEISMFNSDFPTVFKLNHFVKNNEKLENKYQLS